MNIKIDDIFGKVINLTEAKFEMRKVYLVEENV